MKWSTPTASICRPLLEGIIFIYCCLVSAYILCSRKRSASVQSYTVSDSDGVEVVSDSMQAKRLKKVRPGSPEYHAMSPVTITSVVPLLVLI